MRSNRRNKKRIKKGIIVLLIIILLVILFAIIFPKKSNNNNKLIGSWKTEGGTIYEFNKDNKGKMIVPLENYDFKYKIEKDKLYIDYVSEKADDVEYKYTIDGDKLTLEGTRGTFKFTKK